MGHLGIDATAADRSAAIESAKELFWRRGYEDASIEDIVQATGLNRYGIYNAFGGKLELFLAVLDAYYNQRKTAFLNGLEAQDAVPIEAIKHIFELSISDMAERNAGCLICDVAAEIGRHHELVSARIKNYLTEIKAAYTQALTRAKERGELNTTLEPADGAALLITLKLGLGVHAKTGSSPEEMLQILNAAITMLRKADSA